MNSQQTPTPYGPRVSLHLNEPSLPSTQGFLNSLSLVKHYIKHNNNNSPSSLFTPPYRFLPSSLSHFPHWHFTFFGPHHQRLLSSPFHDGLIYIFFLKRTLRHIWVCCCAPFKPQSQKAVTLNHLVSCLLFFLSLSLCLPLPTFQNQKVRRQQLGDQSIKAANLPSGWCFNLGVDYNTTRALSPNARRFLGSDHYLPFT